MKQMMLTLISASLLATCGLAVAETPPSSFGRSLPALLEWADTHSPNISAMRFEADARHQQIESAGAFDDPSFKIEWMDIDGSNPSLAPSKVGAVQYTVTQNLPFWGKRALKSQSAHANAQASTHAVTATRAQVRAEIRSAYAQWYRALASLRINQEQISLLQQMLASAEQRYAVGKAPQAQVLRLQMERSLLQNETLKLQQQSALARSYLAGWLNLPETALVAEPLSLPMAASDSEDWQTLARQRNPQLAAVQQQAAAAQAKLQLAQLNNYPNVNIGLSTKQMQNKPSTYGLMLQFQIPLQQGAKNAEKSEAAAMLMKAQSDQEALQRQLERDVAQLRINQQAAQQQLALLDQTLLPQADLTLQSALAAYSTGRGEFAALLDAEQQTRRLRLMRLTAEYDAFQALNGLQKLIGDQE